MWDVAVPGCGTATVVCLPIAAPMVGRSLVRLSVWRVRRFLMDCLITWGAAATDGGCRLVAAATVWRVAGRFALVGRAVVRLCSLALVVRVLFAACVLAWLAAFDDVRSRVARVSIGIVACAERWWLTVCWAVGRLTACCCLFMFVLSFCGVFYFVCSCSFC